MSKIGNAILEELENGNDMETLIEKGFNYENSQYQRQRICRSQRKG